MGRKILAILAGLIAGFVLVFLIEEISYAVYPPPAELDMTNTEQMSAYIQTLPVGAFLFGLAALVFAAFGGGVVAWIIAKDKPMLFASIIGALLLAASVINLVMIPHPTWYSISAVIGIVLATFLAGKIGQAKFAKTRPAVA